MNSPQRDVPIIKAIAIIFARGKTLGGWSTLAIGMIFVWVFGIRADTSFIYSSFTTQTTEGHVLEVVETNSYIDDESVWANVFEYRDEAGNQYLRDAFTSDYTMKIGDKVTVEYPVQAPEYGRIPGTRTAEFDSWMLFFILLFPVPSVFSVFSGISQGIRDHSLLKTGKLAKAKLIEKKATNTKVNDKTVYKLTFEYTDENNQSFHKTLKNHAIDHLTDDEFERLLYNPKNPAKSTLVDDLAGKPQIADDGTITKLNPLYAIAGITVPIICIVPHIWWYFTQIA
jgi:hypothetical protein